MNEKDLADRGIDINPSELDFLSPVINPTKRPMSPHFHAQTFTPLADGKIQEIMPAHKTLDIIKNLLGISSSFQKNYQKHQATTATPPGKDERLLETKAKAKYFHSKADVKTNSTSQEKFNQNRPMSTYIHIDSTNPKEHKFRPKQEYHNIYDLDRPVKIKRVQKYEEFLPKEKQEVLNNTLAVYGLRLDPKGQNVILQDPEEHPTSLKSKNRIEGKEMKGHKGIHKKIAMKKTKEKMHGKHFKKKNVDTIKSLWNILNNVLMKWK